jgi:hypothetical protein
MQRATAIIRHGRVELIEPVDWPDGTPVQVLLLQSAQNPVSWLSARRRPIPGSRTQRRPPRGDA